MSYPVRPVELPEDLKGQKNGQLAPRLLVAVPGGKLHHAAASAWMKMHSAALRDGITLTPTSPVDTYRPYEVQVGLFQTRYDRIPRQTDSKIWNGVRYWLKPGYAMAAVPGTSNHGWGLAIDVAGASGARLDWLVKHAPLFGFSWEAQSEPWHIRYVRGWKEPQQIPPFDGPYKIGDRGPAVKAIQKALGGLIVDGIYGTKTARAVRTYRQKHPRLWPASTVCNEATYNHLTRRV